MLHFDIEVILSGFVKIAARHKIKSTSFSGPENEYDAVCVVMSFTHESKGTTSTSSCSLFLVSAPHSPPTIGFNEQQTSIFCNMHVLN